MSYITLSSKCLTLITSILILGGTLSCGDPQERYSEIQTSISGRVVNSVTGAPLQNVAIRTEPVSQAVLTDTYGDYRLSLNLKVGQIYLVKARKMNFETEEVSVYVEEGENTTGDIVLQPVSY
jgi:hypothetical protein